MVLCCGLKSHGRRANALKKSGGSESGGLWAIKKLAKLPSRGFSVAKDVGRHLGNRVKRFELMGGDDPTIHEYHSKDR
jgi:hypothetical protein